MISEPSTSDTFDVHRTGLISFWIAGHPVQQGSMRAFTVGGKARVTHTNPTGLQAWRYAIASEAQRHFANVTSSAVGIVAEFVLPRPKSLPKTKERPHISAPDSDKLGRSALDAMSGIVYVDDRQVNRLVITKRYAAIGEQSGVRISVEIQ